MIVDLDQYLWISLLLFGVTALLLVLAQISALTRIGRGAALAALLTVSSADYFMLMSYAGERPLDLSLPRLDIPKLTVVLHGREDGDDDGLIRGRIGHGRGGGFWLTIADGASLRARLVSQSTPRCLSCPDVVYIRPGSFRMGAADDDADAGSAERPARQVRIAHQFAIGRQEVTVGQFAAFLDATHRAPPICPGVHTAPNPRLPVSCVSVRDALAYMSWLSGETGLTYRLPSEAEWEYAARGSVDTRFVTGDTLSPRDANIGAAAFVPTPAGTYPANANGLFDVHGNVAELTADCWMAHVALLPGNGRPAGIEGDCSARTLRDAAASEPPSMARLSARRPVDVDTRMPGVGFRVAREIE